MCVKLSPKNLNPDPYLPHLTNTYTCGVTIAPRVCGGRDLLNYLLFCYFEKVLNYLLDSTMKIVKMTIVIINSMVVFKGFLKRQGAIIELINSYNIVVDFEI